MALRLTGEEYSVVQGLDGLGWLRDVTVSSSDPALKVDQKGTGPILEFQDGGSIVAQLLDGGAWDLRKPVEFGAGAAFTAGNYQIGRNADATNRLQLNVPTGAVHELSINDAEALLIPGVGIIRFPADGAITGGEVEIGRVATNDLAFNVPTGNQFAFREQGTNKWKIFAGSIQGAANATGPYILNEVPSATNPVFVPSGDDLDTGIGHGAGDELQLIAGALEIAAFTNVAATRRIGFYAVTPVVQASKINDPSGGATVDAEARTAINAIIDSLEGIGITAAV